MANRSKLDQLRDAVLGNGRGREVEVEPTGEIRVPEENEANGPDHAEEEPIKPSKMSRHTFGA